MCLGALDFRKVRKIKSILNRCTDDLIVNHRDILCKNPARDFVRNRDFTPGKVISTLLRFGSKNTESELIDILDCQNTGRNINAAFLQQRKKLGTNAFPWLFHSFTENVMSDRTLGLDKCLFHGYHLLACDGSDVNIAYNPHDPDTFIAKKGKRGYNQIHLNALYDVCTGAWMSANVQGIHKKQERKALVGMLSNLRCAGKSIITADRGYESFNVFAACMESGAKFVIRLKDIESNGIISAYDLPDGEFDTYIATKLTKRRTKETLSHPETYTVIPFYTDFDFFDDDDQTYEICVRIIRFRLPNGSYVVVATNLDENEFGIRMIAELYNRRWGCETGFRKLKYTVGLVNFHSWRLEYILQELYARLILFNFCAFIVKALGMSLHSRAGATACQTTAEEKTGIAFSQAVTVCRMLMSRHSYAFIKNAIDTIRAHVFISQDGRSNARKVKPQSNKPFTHRPS